MAGLDNGTLQSGIRAQVKQFGSILRGNGPPVPTAGVLGDLYTDTQTWFLYAKRDAEAIDQWGHPLFQIPPGYRDTLKWFSATLPDGSVGVDGDYCLLWAGYNNYGLQPAVYGPKIDGEWPESGEGPVYLLDPTYAGFELPVGLDGGGALVAYSTSTQLVVCGLLNEYILAIPVAQLPNSPVDGVGLMYPPATVEVDINPLYTAADSHAV